MAKNRFINTKFWSDSFISELNPLDRYLFLYLLTNEHTNICGIYELPIRVMSNESGIEQDMLGKMFKRLKGKIWHIDGWVYIKNFEKHQLSNESVRIGIDNAKKLVPDKIWLKIKELDSVTQTGDRLGTDCDLSESESKLESEPEHKQSVQSPQINPLIDLFKTVNPSYGKLYANKTQRAAAERMLKIHGFEKLQKMIAYLPISNTTKFMPVITTPVQLEDKMGQLASAWQKEQKTQKTIL